MANDTEERLWFWAKKFSNHFKANGYEELNKVVESLKDPTPLDNRKRALVFSMYQLLINGAISEHNIQAYQSDLPKFASDRLNDNVLKNAVTEAWAGSAYTPPRSNILGSIAFMVVLLFFLESACRMELDDDDRSLQKMLAGLKGIGKIEAETYDALTYLAEFRNTWHNFGFHKTSKPKCSYQPRGGSLTFPELIPGQVIKPLDEPQALHLLGKLLRAFCKLTDVKL